MVAKEKGSIPATNCAAGKSNMRNCDNQTVGGISVPHYISKDETLRQKWIRFVRIHAGKVSSLMKKPALCCAHFTILVGGRLGRQLQKELVTSFRGSAFLLTHLRIRNTAGYLASFKRKFTCV